MPCNSISIRYFTSLTINKVQLEVCSCCIVFKLFWCTSFWSRGRLKGFFICKCQQSIVTSQTCLVTAQTLLNFIIYRQPVVVTSHITFVRCRSAEWKSSVLIGQRKRIKETKPERWVLLCNKEFLTVVVHTKRDLQWAVFFKTFSVKACKWSIKNKTSPFFFYNPFFGQIVLWHGFLHWIKMNCALA